MGLYDEPSAGELQARSWDPHREYSDTYPARVPPQWVAFDRPPPRRRLTWAQWIVLIGWIIAGVLQALGAFGTAARAVLPIRD